MLRLPTSVHRPPGEPQIVLGQNKSFTFDSVYFMESEQQLIFRETVQPLIDGCGGRHCDPASPLQEPGGPQRHHPGVRADRLGQDVHDGHRL